MSYRIERALDRAAAAIDAADAVLIGAGAGLGVDSGLPDFRGSEGFWNTYPMLHGKHYAEISSPGWFAQNPREAWGFWGHCHDLYRKTVPHDGFHILRQWADDLPLTGFVFTSNVDGQFQRAGFPTRRIVERHGSIRHLQCSQQCSRKIWRDEDLQLEVDPETLTLTSDLPECPHCGELARPNVLLFDDLSWNPRRYAAQLDRYIEWLGQVHGHSLVSIELGAGTAVPRIRLECEQRRGKLIRINPRDHSVPDGAVSIPLGALDALQRIDRLL